MDITFDPTKRDDTLKARGLDFADAGEVFSGPTLTTLDDRFGYGEDRFITYGELGGRIVVLVWTPRGAARRIISMRHCHEHEAAKVRDRLR